MKHKLAKQYQDLKSTSPDKLAIIRFGDFYEAFGDDANTLAKVLCLTVTTRIDGDTLTPMCGFPTYYLATYLEKLIGAGHRVAIGEYQS